MKIVMRALDELTPYENNPRKNDDAVDGVAASLQEFGWQQPIVVDRKGVIIAGHTRYKAALKLGMTEAPCVVADDLTPEQVKAYRLADNKTGEKAQWDFELLEADLSDILDIDMEALGFEGVEDAFSPNAIDLDGDAPARDPDMTLCHCPKCGFTFEVKK